MKNIMTILATIIGFAFSQEFEVDGNLKVIGNIDASNQRITNVGSPTTMQDAVNSEFLQEALSNAGPFEFEYYNVKFESANDNGTFETFYRPIGVGNTWTSDWVSFINQKSADGWEINATYGGYTNAPFMYVYELRKKTE